MPDLNCGKHQLDLSVPCVMGILNATPDSFSDGGQFSQLDAAVAHAEEMAQSGAAIIDIGGESTRPGAAPVSAQEEMDRVVPVFEALRKRIELPLSIDTSKPAVMREAVNAGACLINDVRALQGPGALAMAADCGVAVCLMHMQGQPRTMQASPVYGDVIQEVVDFLLARTAASVAAGISRDKIVVDPGFGFGKTLEHNQALLKHLDALLTMGLPILVGMSQKTMIGQMLGDVAPSERMQGSVAAAVIAAWQGASILRVHNVSETVKALKIVSAVRRI